MWILNKTFVAKRRNEFVESQKKIQKGIQKKIQEDVENAIEQEIEKEIKALEEQLRIRKEKLQKQIPNIQDKKDETKIGVWRNE